MNTITLVQGLLIALLAAVVGIDSFLEALFIFRPIIVSTLVGIILGDLRLGLISGGLVELTFVGLTPAGGTQPPNHVVAAIMTTVLAYITGKDVRTAIGLSLPFSFLMQYIVLFYYSSFSLFVPKFDKYAEDGNDKAYIRLSFLTQGIIGISYLILVFLCVYVAQEPMKIFVESLPAWLTHGFEITGGILPAVGFGLLLNLMLKVRHIPFFIVGFLMATFFAFTNLLPIALVGLAFAIYKYFTMYENDVKLEKLKQQIEKLTKVDKEEYTDGI